MSAASSSIASQGFDPAARGPLAGVRVLDLSRLVAGNMLTLQLADFGAEVIKVEPPGKGDPLRDWTDNGVSTYWKVYGRNKKSLTLDLRAAGAAGIVLKLAETAQILVESFRPGRLEDMGLGPEILHARNPALVVVRVSGFGQTGPYRERPGFGSLVEAMSGFASRNGFPDRDPLLPPMALADMIAGLQGAYATMVALRQVESKGGPGQIIDLSLFEPILATLGAEALSYQVLGTVKQRLGNRSNLSAPRDIYRTRDGLYVTLSASIQTMAERVFRVIGRPDMVDDPRYRSHADRVRHRDQVNDIVAEWVAARDQAEVLRLFTEAGVAGAPVYDIRGIIADPHVVARQVLVDLPDEELGQARHHNISPRLSRTPGVFRRPAPALGEHSEAILEEAGFDAEAIAEFRDGGMI